MPIRRQPPTAPPSRSRRSSFTTFSWITFKDSGGSIQLLWKRPSAELAVIPQTQLYPFTNPPPAIATVTPANDASYAASASVTFGVEARTLHNPVAAVEFFANGKSLGALNSSIYAPVYALTTTGLNEGRYTLTAVATDGSGLSSTSAPVNITVTAGSGLPYGLTTAGKSRAVPQHACHLRRLAFRRCFPAPACSATPPAARLPAD